MTIQARFHLEFPPFQYVTSAQRHFALDVDLTLSNRGITAIFGHSGSGKTTLLRCMAGLQKTAQGLLKIGNHTWQDGNTFLAPHQRSLGYVFQEAGLLPHLNVQANLLYGQKRGNARRAKALPRTKAIEIDQAVSFLDIGHLLTQYSHQLSGGERQRVAIASALLTNPELLLMDEPLASLDMARKQEILPYLERLHRELEIPVLYVTHAIDEVARLADHLVVLDQGKPTAHGPLMDVLSRIDTSRQLGEDTGTVLQATVAEKDSQWNLVKLTFSGGELWLRDSGDGVGESVRVRILARDISIALTAHRDSSILNVLPVKVEEIARDSNEAMSLIRLKAGNSVLIARVTRRSVEQLGLAVGMQVWAQVKSAAVVR